MKNTRLLQLFVLVIAVIAVLTSLGGFIPKANNGPTQCGPNMVSAKGEVRATCSYDAGKFKFPSTNIISCEATPNSLNCYVVGGSFSAFGDPSTVGLVLESSIPNPPTSRPDQPVGQVEMASMYQYDCNGYTGQLRMPRDNDGSLSCTDGVITFTLTEEIDVLHCTIFRYGWLCYTNDYRQLWIHTN